MLILFFNQKNPGSRRRQGDERHRKQARQGSKEYAVARVKEYEEKGYIEGYPECRLDPDFLKPVDTGI
jgi:hypothetical protein